MKNRLVILLFACVSFFSTQIFAAEVNINKASAEQIALSLNGIGNKKAVAIVEFRKKHGPFKKVEDLAKVSGIGLKTLDKIKNLIKLGAIKQKKKR